MLLGFVYSVYWQLAQIWETSASSLHSECQSEDAHCFLCFPPTLAKTHRSVLKCCKVHNWSRTCDRSVRTRVRACVCVKAYALLAFSLLRDGFQRMQERCSSRQKSLTSPLDPAFSFTICVPDCITLMHRSTAEENSKHAQKQALGLLEHYIKTQGEQVPDFICLFTGRRQAKSRRVTHQESSKQLTRVGVEGATEMLLCATHRAAFCPSAESSGERGEGGRPHERETEFRFVSASFTENLLVAAEEISTSRAGGGSCEWATVQAAREKREKLF